MRGVTKSSLRCYYGKPPATWELEARQKEVLTNRHLREEGSKVGTWSRTPRIQPLGKEDANCLDQKAELSLAMVLVICRLHNSWKYWNSRVLLPLLLQPPQPTSSAQNTPPCAQRHLPPWLRQTGPVRILTLTLYMFPLLVMWQDGFLWALHPLILSPGRRGVGRSFNVMMLKRSTETYSYW